MECRYTESQELRKTQKRGILSEISEFGAEFRTGFSRKTGGLAKKSRCLSMKAGAEFCAEFRNFGKNSFMPVD
jgi:hypothetical protein